MMNLRFKSFGNCSKGTCKSWVHRTPEPCKEWVSSPGRWEVVGWIGSLSTSLPVSHSTWQSPTEPVLSKWCAMNKQGNPAFCGRLDFSTGLSDPLKLTEQEIKYTSPSLCCCYELVRVWQWWEGPGGIFFPYSSGPWECPGWYGVSVRTVAVHCPRCCCLHSEELDGVGWALWSRRLEEICEKWLLFLWIRDQFIGRANALY